MVNIYTSQEIIEKIDFWENRNELTTIIENSFVSLSRNEAFMPTPGELVFENPPGDCHIKYGYVNNLDYFIVKISSGFYDNHLKGLPPGDGMMSLWSKKTGHLESIFLDNGLLTNIRTAIAGRIATKFLAPKKVKYLGVIGTGIQARLQVKYIRDIVNFEQVLVTGRNSARVAELKKDLTNFGLTVQSCEDSKKLCEKADIVITTTASTKPYIFSSNIRSNMHITAIGADTQDKNEIDPSVYNFVDHIILDSKNLSSNKGDIFHAIKSQTIEINSIKEIGEIVEKNNFIRSSSTSSICNLTGIASQDIAIATWCYNYLTQNY